MLKIWKFIEDLRKQPDEAKRGFAFVASSAITALIVVSYLILPENGLRNPENETKNMNELLTPLDALKNTVGAGFDEMGANLSQIKSIRDAHSGESASSITATSTEEIATTTLETKDAE